MNNSSKKSNRIRRVAFASIELTMDFASLEDAIEYKRANQGKGWLFRKPYSIDSGDGFVVCMIVKKPYRDYNPGW